MRLTLGSGEWYEGRESRNRYKSPTMDDDDDKLSHRIVQKTISDRFRVEHIWEPEFSEFILV